MSECLFCKILVGTIPSTKVYEDDKVIAFQDLRPQAKIHLLFIHRNHTKNINDLAASDPESLKDIFLAMKMYSESKSIDQKGYRVVTNLGPDAGQTVFHTHFHFLAGENLGTFGS